MLDQDSPPMIDVVQDNPLSIPGETSDSAKLRPNSQNRWRELSKKIRFFWGSLFYLTYAPQAYLYTKKRDRLEETFAEPPGEVVENPGKLLDVCAIARGAQFVFEEAELDVSFLAPDLVRLTWKPGLEPVPYAIAQQNWPQVETTLSETEGGWQVSSAALRVTVDVEGRVMFYGASGQLLRDEMPPRREGDAWKHQAHLPPEATMYGLGERAAPLNVRQPDKTYRMWNYDAAGMYGPGSDPMYISIPIYLSLNDQGSYLIFYENSFAADFTFDEVATAAFEGGSLRYYVAVGTPAQVMERYTELTGRSPLPPRWALGYHQSRWGYRTEEAVRETVRTFKALNLPLSAIHLDIDVQVGFRAFTLDPKRFPKLAQFTQELADDGVRFITIINPGVKYSSKSKLFLEGQLLDVFCKFRTGELATGPVWCGRSAFPDFTHPLARQWWSRQYEFLLDMGLAGFWHDMNEPAVFITSGDRSLPPKATLHYMEGRGGDHREAHNLYGFLQAKAGYESLCQYRPQKRPFIVSRSGWAGLQRYSWTWTGDVECTWEAMKQTIATILGLGISGIPYSGSDIGGFQGNPPAELYVRWFQMATFMPFFRSHCSNNVEYRAPWTYGEPYLSIMRNFLKLRYQLMPYFYTLAWESTQKGYPLVRPLFWQHPEEKTLWSVDDAFYLGDALLVAPVFEEGGRSRLVVLPPGRWYSFWDDTLVEGGQQVELRAPLDQVPLLVRAGSILPMNLNNQLVLHLYPPEQDGSEGQMYSDAGDGYDEGRLDRVRLVRFADGVEIFWEQEGAYSFPYTSIQVCFHGFQAKQAWVDGREVDVQNEDQTASVVVSEPVQQMYVQGTFGDR